MLGLLISVEPNLTVLGTKYLVPGIPNAADSVPATWYCEIPHEPWMKIFTPESKFALKKEAKTPLGEFFLLKICFLIDDCPIFASAIGRKAIIDKLVR